MSLTTIAIGVVGVAIITAAGTLTVDDWRYTGRIDALKLDYSAKLLKAAQDKDSAEHRYAEQSTKAKEAYDVQQRTIERQAADLASAQAHIVVLVSDTGRLRKSLSAYASGGPNDSTAACEQRAATLAGLLSTAAALVDEGGGLVTACAALARSSAIAAEQHGTALNACVAAWPH